VEAAHRETAERFHRLIADGRCTPARLREALARVPPRERDAWIDAVFRLEPPLDDGPELPRGCVPYLPCSVAALLQALDYANVQASDVFVDVGSGAGRTSALVQLLTGASVIGLEIQPNLIQASHELMRRLNLTRFVAVEGDARRLSRSSASGTVFFLYCPFGPSSLETFLESLEQLAHTREIRLCSVDLPLPPRRWLTLSSPVNADCAVYRSSV
jgi:protein-L-isoaspartate O-methyltransferase